MSLPGFSQDSKKKYTGPALVFTRHAEKWIATPDQKSGAGSAQWAGRNDIRFIIPLYIHVKNIPHPAFYISIDTGSFFR